MQSSFSTAQQACQGPLQEHLAPTQVTMSSCLWRTPPLLKCVCYTSEGKLPCYSELEPSHITAGKTIYWQASIRVLTENAIAQDLIILLSIGDEDVAALEEEAGRKFVYAIRFTVICVLLGMAIKIFPSLGRYFLFLCTCTAKKQGCTLFWQQLFSFNMLCTELHHANSILSVHSSWN